MVWTKIDEKEGKRKYFDNKSNPKTEEITSNSRNRFKFKIMDTINKPNGTWVTAKKLMELVHSNVIKAVCLQPLLIRRKISAE
jgi:hypothetical protein